MRNKCAKMRVQSATNETVCYKYKWKTVHRTFIMKLQNACKSVHVIKNIPTTAYTVKTDCNN